MNYFIKNIHVNKLFHLNNFDIPIDDEKYPHLIITGKNGSGKTILLNAVSDAGFCILYILCGRGH